MNASHVTRGRWLAAAILALAAIAPLQAYAQSFSVAPTSGSGTVTPVATWNVPGATTCTASGGWSGTKAASGTETLAAITKSTTYGLTCVSVSATGSVSFTWTNPTLRTDGTALTNLAATRIYRGTSATALGAPIDTASPTQTAQDIAGLAPGTWYFAATAVDANGVESARTPTVSKVVTGTSTSIPLTNVTVSVQSLPNPPTGFTVVAVVDGVNVSPAYPILWDGSRGERVAGFVAVGTPVDQRIAYRYRGRDYCRVAQDAVAWWGTRPTDRVAVACAAAPAG